MPFTPTELDYLGSQRLGRVAFVVDDIASVEPWRVRCVEIRGHAEGTGG